MHQAAGTGLCPGGESCRICSWQLLASFWAWPQEEAHQILDQRYIQTEPTPTPTQPGSACFSQPAPPNIPGGHHLGHSPPGHTLAPVYLQAAAHQPELVISVSGEGSFMVGPGPCFSLSRCGGWQESRVPPVSQTPGLDGTPGRGSVGYRKGLHPQLALHSSWPGAAASLVTGSGAGSNHF